MACNGFNHPPECTCDFRGGHAGSSPPPAPPASLLGALAPPAWRPRVAVHKPRPCPRCGMPVCFVNGPRGGNYVAAGDGSYFKHRCPKAVPREPLRLRPAGWRKDCFTAAIKPKRRVGQSQRLEITGLAEGAPFPVEVLDGLQVDAKVPAICRWSKTEVDILELAYLNSESGELSGTIVRVRRIRRIRRKAAQD